MPSGPPVPPRGLTVVGELVADLLPVPGADAGPEGTAPQFVARPGGNALNVAVAAGRLGAPVALAARLGSGPLAGHLRRHAELSGVDLTLFVDAPEPVSLAVVGLRPDGSADYGFHVQGAADWQWRDEELAGVPERTAILHVGSISSWTPPGCDAVAALVERFAASGSGLVSVDPNLRPALAEGPVGGSLGNSRDAVHQRLDRLIARADVVKVSAEDLAWLEPDLGTDPAALDEAAQRWAGRGPVLVLLTDGGAPLRVARPGAALLRQEIPRVAVADTVGAGDSLAAALFTGLLRTGVATRPDLARLPDEQLLALVGDATLVAALTCTRVGADPPTAADLAVARAGQLRGAAG